MIGFLCLLKNVLQLEAKHNRRKTKMDTYKNTNLGGRVASPEDLRQALFSKIVQKRNGKGIEKGWIRDGSGITWAGQKGLSSRNGGEQ